MIIASWPSARSAAQIAAVRRSCQTMAFWSGAPVARSQTSVVSRWLVMPMAAIPAAPSGVFEIASRQVSSVEAQISAGSCSTQPDCGKICGNSFWAIAAMPRASSKRIARLDVVPWSMARTCFMVAPSSAPYTRRRSP